VALATGLGGLDVGGERGSEFSLIEEEEAVYMAQWWRTAAQRFAGATLARRASKALSRRVGAPAWLRRKGR
jgi:hypothetical protein